MLDFEDVTPRKKDTGYNDTTEQNKDEEIKE